MRIRSLLFAPGDRPDLVAKLAASQPDAVVVDLEDGMRPGPLPDLDATAAAVREARAEAPELPVFVRIQPARLEADVAWARSIDAAGLVVPKVEGPGDAARAGVLAPGLPVIAGIETARAVLRAEDLLAPPVVAVYFGAEDFAADVGGTRTPEGTEVLFARSRVLLAARVTGVVPIDVAVVEVRDAARFEADAKAGRALGYAGKICLHPSQVEIANRVFSPSPAELEWARRIVEAWDGAGAGAAVVDGQMVDEPLAKRARALLGDAG